MSKQPQSSQGAKGTPSSAPTASAVLNDETWSTYIYAIAPDERTGISLQAAYDMIGSGYRSRFTVFSKADLMGWYSENIKADYCKDFKAALDANGGNDNEVPEAIMARLIKQRLLILKQEGIEKRTAAKLAAETPTTPPTQLTAEAAKAGVKSPAKDDKSKDRAKSPGKKGPTGKGDKKVPEITSRPESATPAEISKRKTKLRDKGAKSDSKIVSIGDEPLDGPDSYILLKDFHNLKVLNALMEEYDVPLHCIFRVVPHLEGAGTGLEVKVMERAGLTDVAPVNRVLAEAREWCDSAGEDSYWRGVAWNVIKLPATLGSGQTGASPPTNAAAATAPPGIAGAPNSSPGGTAGSSVPGGLDGKEIFDAIALRIYSQLRMRRDFKTVYSDEKVVLIPGITDVNIVKTQMRSLGGLLDLMPYSVFLNSEILLGTVVEQSMRALKAEEDVDAMNGMDPVPLTLIDDMGPLVSYFEKSLKKLSLGVGKSMGIGASGMVGFGTTPPEPSKLKFSRFGDNLTTSKYMLGDLSSYSYNTHELIASTLDTFPMLQYQSTVRETTGFLDPSQKVANLEELRKCSDANFSDIIRVLLQNHCEDLLKQGKTVQDWNLNDWCWFENLDKSSMIQVLQSTKVSHPVVLSKVCDKTGKLIIVMAGEGGVGTKQYDGEFELHVKTKVNFGLYHELLETFRSFVNIAPLPKTKSETIQRSPVYSSGDSVVQRKDKFTIMYPSDGGKITVHRDQHLNFRQDIRTSIDYKDTHIIFASSEQSKNGPYLTAVLENDVVFSVAEIDGLSNVVLSCANGLIIEFRNNGTIVQKHDALLSSQMSDGTVKGNPLEELSRVIMQDGTVIRYLNNTLVEVLFSDGTTAMSSKEGWITTSNDGTRKMTNSAGESSDLVGIKYARETIIALNETIITREDMVIATQKKDGSLITEHADGTLLQTDVTAGVVMVEKEGMAKVIFKGDGKSVLLKLKDGSIVEKTESDHAKAKYKISDEYNTFEFETSLDGLSSFRVKSSPDQFVTYKFDWMNGTLETLDSSGTKFIVTSSGACSTVEESQVPLASAGDNVVRNKCPGFVRSLVDTPILPLDSSARNPPRLFIIDENGSGIQLLRDLDLVPYFKKQLHNPNCEILEEILEELCVTLIGKEYGQTEGSNDIVIYRQLTRHGEISANKRAQIKADIDAYSQVKAKMDFVPKPQNWQETGASLEATTAGFQEVAPIAFEDAENVEAVEVPPVRRPTALVLGQSRQKTIEELMKLYKIPKRGQMIQEGENKIKKEVHHLLKEERLTKKRQSNILDASH